MLGDGMRVIALKVLVQACGVLLEVCVGHGECSAERQTVWDEGNSKRCTVLSLYLLSVARIQTHVADLGDSQEQPLQFEVKR